jgi:hypothetical protein
MFDTSKEPPDLDSVIEESDKYELENRLSEFDIADYEKYKTGLIDIFYVEL